LVLISFTLTHADESPKRIISLSPNLTQIIYALDSFDSIAGVTIYEEFPPQAKELPKVGGWVNPNLEAIMELKPDLVVFMKDQDIIFGDKIRSLGLKTYLVDSNNSVADILQSISDLGDILGKKDEALALTLSLKRELDQVQEHANGKPKKKTLIVVGRNPGTLEDIYVIGQNNYINELLTIAGGENVIENQRLSLKITKEAIYSLDPDIIVEVNHRQPTSEKEILEVWSTLTEVRVVKNNQVYIVPSTVLLHPSQRIVPSAKVLSEILHPSKK